MKNYTIPILIIVGIILLLVLIVAGVVGYYNYRASQAPEQIEFKKGNTSKFPDGSYNGKAMVDIGSWRGKSFDAINKTGINRFADGNRYKFTTFIGKGLTDDQDVIKIDYNQPSNPWWLRLVTDEIVQVAPNEYIGKIQIVVVPGLPITFGLFRLNNN